jgi:two-component system chemotaxis sensor kinase CheA
LEARKIGLIVDGMEGEEELVIKTLDDHAIVTDLVSGASILGDGRVVLIVNVAAILERFLKIGARSGAGTMSPACCFPRPRAFARGGGATMTPSAVRVLVVDDSALMRKLIPQILESDKSIQVVGTAMDGNFGLKKDRGLEAAGGDARS